MVVIEIADYLKGELVKNGDTATILDEGEIRSAEDTPFGREVFEIKVEIKNVPYIWTMNKTTQRALMKKWGRDTSKWIGKKVKLSVREQNVRGTMRKVVYGEPA